MIIKISTHRRGSRPYKAVLRRLKKDLRGQPRFVTVIPLPVPQPRQYSAIALEYIDQYLTPLIKGQACTHFGKIKSALQFWKEDGYLSGVGAVHLYAHLLLEVIRSQGRQHLALHKNDPRKVVRIQERIYRPTDEDKTTINLVLTGRYQRKELLDSTTRLWAVLEAILENGEPALPRFKDNRPLSEQVADKLKEP